MTTSSLFNIQELLKAKVHLKFSLNELRRILTKVEWTHYQLADFITLRSHLVEYDANVNGANKQLNELDEEWHKLAESNPNERQRMSYFFKDEGDYSSLFTDAKLAHYEAKDRVAELDKIISQIQTLNAANEPHHRLFSLIPGHPNQQDDKSLPSENPFLPTFKLPKVPPPRPSVPPRVNFQLHSTNNETSKNIIDRTPTPRLIEFNNRDEDLDSEYGSSNNPFATTTVNTQTPLWTQQASPQQQLQMSHLVQQQWPTTMQQSPILVQQTPPTVQQTTPLAPQASNLAQHIPMQTQQLLPSMPTQSPINWPQAAVSQVGLPQFNYLPITPIQIQKFNGKSIKEWPSFYELFTATIDSQAYPDVYKFATLKNLLEEPALNCIKSLTITSANYREALKLLHKRYGNSALIESSLHTELRTLAISNITTNQLRKTLDSIEQILSQLENLGIDVNNGTLSDMIMAKFPDPLYSELVVARRNNPKWCTKALRDRLEEMVNIREEIDQSKPHHLLSPSNGKPETKGKPKLKFPSSNCIFCDGEHFSAHCPTYSTPEKRKLRAKALSLCKNCLRIGHSKNECTNPKCCQMCSKRHHTLLHIAKTFDPNAKKQNAFNRQAPQTVAVNQLPNAPQAPRKPTVAHAQAPWNAKGTYGAAAQSQRPNQPPHKNAWSHVSISEEQQGDETNADENETQVVAQTNLSTVCFKLNTHFDNESNLLVAPIHLSTKETNFEVLTHALFDSGCNLNFVSSLAINRLGLSPIGKRALKISRFACSAIENVVCPFFNLQITLKDGNKQSILVYEIEKVCNPVPQQLVHPNNKAFETDEDIQPHILLGNPTFLSLLLTGLQQTDNEGEAFIKTKVGKIFVHTNAQKSLTQSSNLLALAPLKSQVHFFDQRYWVKWPFKIHLHSIDNHFSLAFFRCKTLIKRLFKEPDLLKRYDDEIRRMYNEGVIEIVFENSDNKLVRYVPHHAVFKPNKIRLVFDASARRINSPSLNELLHKGENLLPLLTSVLLRFRLPKYFIIADISKAFNNLVLTEDQRDITRFLWLKDSNYPFNYKNMLIFRFVRLPFGYASSPWLLADVLHKHLKKFGTFGYLLLVNLYVDNLFWAVSNFEEAVKTLHECIEIFKEASMPLHEINSNMSQFIKYLNSQGLETPKTIKFLGLKINFVLDQFEFSLPVVEDSETLTKRISMHFSASIFDPLGFVAPITLKARLFVQNLWSESLHWDTPIPDHLLKTWTQLTADWSDYVFVIPRRTEIPKDSYPVELHTFVDASKNGRGAVSYLLTENEGKRSVSFIQAKSRLNPSKNSQTIPRLELMALLMGVEAQQQIKNDFCLDIPIRSYVWSDNASALWWSKAKPDKKLPIFVRHRVDQIQLYKDVEIRYVPGEMNIADLASRGCTATELSSNREWFCGPEWLKDPTNWPEQLQDLQPDPETTAINNNSTVQVGLTRVSEFDFTQFSSFKKMVKSLYFVFKFFANKIPSFLEKINLANLPMEFDAEAQKLLTLFLVKLAQKQTQISKDQIQAYGLITNEDGLMVRNTRIPKLDEIQRMHQPVFLPRDHHITGLLIMHIHNMNRHPSQEHTFHLVRQNWFIPKGRNIVKRTLSDCFICRRFDCKPFRLPEFPEFPTSRVLPSKPFTHIGLDLFGPFKAKRGEVTIKVYGVIFVCFCTRAIHLELALNCTANCFLHVFRRFVARRGCPKQILSDNAPSLIMVESILHLNTTTAQIQTDLTIQEFLTKHGITWKFIPAFGPWHGGVYESLIKSTKASLHKAIGRRILTEEHLRTVFAEAEGIVNTRPLTYISTDEECPVLSPADFLNVNPLVTPILADDEFDPNDSEWNPTLNNRDILLRSWQHSQVILSKVWKMFQTSYLTSLQDRFQTEHKQNRSLTQREPEINEIVLVKEPELPRCKWRLAKIEQLHSEPHRHATITLGEKNGRRTVTTRPINLLCPLEIRCILTLLLIASFPVVAFSCSEVATLTAPTNNCQETDDGQLNCQIHASTLITLRPTTQEACLQIVNENQTHVAVFVIQPKKLRLTGHTNTIMFSRQTEMKTSHARRCDRGTGSQCFGKFCEEVGDNTKLDDLPDEARSAVGYSRCHRSCGCAWCDKDGENGCFLCSAGCLFYRFYSTPTNNDIFRIFQTPIYEPTLEVSVIMPNGSSIQSALSPALPKTFDYLNITLTVSDIPPLPILAHTFIENVNQQTYAILPNTVDLSIHLHCNTAEMAQKFDCSFPAKTCTCSPSEYKPNCVCSTVDWLAVIQDHSLKLPLDLGNGASLNFHNSSIQLDTQFPSQLHISIQADQVNLITHLSSCTIEFINVTGCLDCETPPSAWFDCHTNFGTTTVQFECNTLILDPIPCHNQSSTYSTKVQSINAKIDENCIANCPANSIDLQISGQLNTKITTQHQSETKNQEKVKVESMSWFGEAINSVKNWFSSISAKFRSWYLFIVIPIIIILMLCICCWFSPQIIAFTTPIINRAREFFRYKSETNTLNATRATWTPLRHRPSWAARLRRPNTASTAF